MGDWHVAASQSCPRGLPLVAPHEHFAGSVQVAGAYEWVCVPSRAASVAVKMVCSVPHTIAVMVAEYLASFVEAERFVFISIEPNMFGETLRLSPGLLSSVDV